MAIHPTAIIDKAAELGPDVDVGPYAIIEGPVRIGAGTRVYPHVYLTGLTEIGENCEIHPFASVGHLPQDFHYSGERSFCRIGDGTVVREHCTIHRGTDPESATAVGRGCFLLAGSHVAHNCQLADEVTLINGVMLGGYVEVGFKAILSGGAGVHQFVRIGEYSMVSGNSETNLDCPPFMIHFGRGLCAGVNRVGMQRAGFSKEEIAEARDAYRQLYRVRVPIPKAIETFANQVQTDVGRRILEFIQAPSKRGIALGPRHGPRGASRE